MKYALLIYQDDQYWTDADDATRAAAYKEHEAFAEKFTGIIQGGAELGPATTATTVRTTGTEHLLTDGPYTETTEQLGGFYIIDAADLDEALTCAKALPASIVEVRTIIGDTER